VLLRKDTAIITIVDVEAGRLNLKYSVIQALLRDRLEPETIADMCRRFGIDRDRFEIASNRQRHREQALEESPPARQSASDTEQNGAAEG